MSERIYLAGPMTGIKDFNFPAFHDASKMLREMGHEVFSPAEQDLLTWGDMETIKAKANYRDCLRVDLNWILDHATAIALLPNWESSTGALAEWALAKALKLKFIYLRGDYGETSGI